MHGRVAASATAESGRVSLPDDVSMGTVSLTVSDLDRSRAFYERAVGLQAVELEDGELALTAGGARPLIKLRGDASAPKLDRSTTGLFHLAILLPSRADLAASLARLAEAHWPLDGASDHLVSEALYLSDPDGNGIEIYRDRPRDEWRYSGDHLQMATLPLDLRSVVAELPSEGHHQPGMPAASRIGHVHLQVSELHQTERFYSDLLGFDVVVRGYPGALFVSAGGYHHHLGLNTWHSAGSGPPEPGSVGLRDFEVLIPGYDELERVLQRVRAGGVAAEPVHPGFVVRDPSGNAAMLRTT